MAYEDMRTHTSAPTIRASIPLNLLPQSLQNRSTQDIGEMLRFIAMERSFQDHDSQLILTQADRFKTFITGDRIVIDFGSVPSESKWSLDSHVLHDPNKPTALQKVRELIAKHLLPEGSTAARQIYVTYGFHNPEGA